MTERILQITDGGHGFLARFRHNEGDYHVSVEVFPIFGWEMKTGAILLEKRGTSETAESLDEAERVLRWDVKWDGCSHAVFGEDDNAGYVHLCGGDGALAFARMLCTVHREALAMLVACGVEPLADDWAGVPAEVFARTDTDLTGPPSMAKEDR
jgi:hypothetical protein